MDESKEIERGGEGSAAFEEAALGAAAPEPGSEDGFMESAQVDVPADDDPPKPEEASCDDALTFSDGVIEKIVAIAMRDVPGVLGMKGSWFNRFQSTFGVDDTTKGVTVEVTPENAVKVNISILMEYGTYAPQVFEDAKRAVVENVLAMTGLEVAGVNLRIEDVLTPEEFERNRARREAEARARRESWDEADEASREKEE